MKRALFCKKCGCQLTQWLTPITDIDEMNLRCKFANSYDGDPVHPVPAGFVLVLEGDVLQARLEAVPGWDGQAGTWVNLADLSKAVGYTSDQKRMIGCCGLDGCDGPNRICSCDAEVGTESSDCWTWHLFVPVAENTSWKNNDH
ncbi:MAG: hypothetical protein P8X77_09315 [Maritimibacter sp.]